MDEENELGCFDATEPKEEPVDLLLKFDKPYVFEGETYTELDLSALEQWNADTICKCERAYRKAYPQSLVPLMETEYRLLAARWATKKPIEFFKRMPPDLTYAVANVVLSFFGR